ncbi:MULTISPECIES: hypothetical protein [unclassified Adlercreutzia]|uniref:hypothetical protein n=1 Tax=unclassified Adlercreutzia TaxID=2636013 RepID=UPI0013EC8EC9|nr:MULTISPECIES: hypothetical protein [unclassified Adlercreutzia]
MEIAVAESKKKPKRFLDASRQKTDLARKDWDAATSPASTHSDKEALVESLVGILPPDFDAQAALDDRRAAI